MLTPVTFKCMPRSLNIELIQGLLLLEVSSLLYVHVAMICLPCVSKVLCSQYIEWVARNKMSPEHVRPSSNLTNCTI